MKKLNYILKFESFRFVISLFLLMGITTVVMGQDILPYEQPIEKPPTDEESLLFYGIVAVLAIGIFLFARYRSKDSNLKRKIKNTKKVFIQDFQDGQSSKIVGNVLPVKNPLYAQLSRKKCVFYHLIIEKERQDNIDDGISPVLYDTIVNEEISCDFYISDNTGLAEIKPQGAEVALLKNIKRMTSLIKGTDERIKTLLEERKLILTDFENQEVGNKFRLKEGILEIGEEIAITGRGHWEENSDPEKRAKHLKSLVFSHNDQFPLRISDNPKSYK